MDFYKKYDFLNCLTQVSNNINVRIVSGSCGVVTRLSFFEKVNHLIFLYFVANFMKDVKEISQSNI